MELDYKTNPPQNRFPGEPPKIGIRPAIDGRLGGVRESLEGQTMALAQSAKKLIEENARHPNGMRVECVTADTCIGGVAEAAACAEKFARAGVGVSLTVSPCWCYGSETMDMDGLTPKAVWGFNGTERPGAVYLAAVLAAHNMKGLPAFSIYGRDVLDAGDRAIPADVSAKILRFARAGLAAAWMRGKSYLSIGATSMGIAGSIVVPDFFEDYLGMRVEWADESELMRRIQQGIYDREEYERALKWAKSQPQGFDPNPIEKQHSAVKKEEVWQTCAKMALIVRDMMCGNPKLAEMGFGEEAHGRNALAAGFQGQRQWTDFMPNGDFMEAVLNSSFDWNGIRQPYIVATENDCLNGAAMLLGHLLTGSAQVFADVRTYWSPEAVKRVTGRELSGRAANGVIHLINSGAAALDGSGRQTLDGQPAMKPWWDVTAKEAEDCAAATQWCYASLGYFRGGGYSSHFVSRGGMPVTMSRINLVKGLGPALQIAEGWTVDLPQDVHSTLEKRTDPTWPTTWFAPRLTGAGAFADVYSVMANWGANHGAFSCGHIGADLISLASMLRIPVCMHNVDGDDVYRPSVWAAFGTKDLEAADYRACANYGPLYGSLKKYR
jgi:L-fucose isomerase